MSQDPRSEAPLAYEQTLPLAGFRVLDYSQFVAGPLATMLLADLGADVVKIESPVGDAYRHYEPLGQGESRRFYALNRNKRSVVCDLKTEAGRALSQRLITTADAVVHNMPPERAVSFGLDPDSIRAVNRRAVVAVVSAFGSAGPQAGKVGYDLIAQAFSGLLMADARVGDAVPRRSGGIPFSDITAGFLACISVAAGLAGRATTDRPYFEVSLLGAALATQVQTFVRTEADLADDDDERVIPADLKRIGAEVAGWEELEPYYRCYQAADGYFALCCLTTTQRRRALDVLGLQDQWVGDPQARPGSAAERDQRAALPRQFERVLLERPVEYWIAAFTRAGVPAGEVRLVDQMFNDGQVRSNGLVRRIQQRQGGPVDVLGALFKIDGVARQSPVPAPQLGEHTDEILDELAKSDEMSNALRAPCG
ncbi:MAG: CoA transferase [Actinomycetota bacterium]|nr:CoA transferase [Actinomycetota bacterium]